MFKSDNIDVKTFEIKHFEAELNVHGKKGVS